jgi:UDP-N-acetylmuramoyl-L-alanyl-D-glutamate--2,6-diaminopimelate ligase
VTLGALVAAVASLHPDSVELVERSGTRDAEVTSIAHDSRAVSKGSVFVAVPGHRTDGVLFAIEAARRGALAVVSESEAPADVPPTVCWLRTDDARVVLADLAATFFGHPSRSLTVVGVTGTNGKTTTTYLLASVFDAAGMPSGRMGTVTVRVGPDATDERDASHTTPEAPEIHRLLREMISRGCRACAMEVSSHALALHRADQVTFAAAIFTNLTRDHLDFHGDMQHYFAAKRRLFDMLPPGAPAIVNVDDPRGAELANTLPRVLSYAIDHPADVRASRIQISLEGIAFEAETPRGTVHVRSSLVGRPNVYNVLGVIAAGIALDLPIAAIERGITGLERVPGRFEMVSRSSDDVRVVVDYAHTDDALKNLLETARPLAHGRLITVFGCGGDRDRSKRPLMGAVAARLSDLVVLTSDNPRSEDPARILAEIKLGLSPTPEPGGPSRKGTAFVEIPDRRRAIEHAIRTAQSGDLVLVAGKGHEKYQVIGDRTLPFDDVDVARAALGQRRATPRV